MKSTGEVMGIAADFPTAFGKAQAAAGVTLPEEGSVFITVTDTDKPAATQLAARFHDLGFEVIATGGTAQAIERMGVPVTRINKLGEGSPHVVDLIRGAPLRPRDQHPDRLRRPRRRLRDPHRRRPPRHPLRDDDDRRHRGRAGDRRRPPGRRRGAQHPGDPRRRRLGARGGGGVDEPAPASGRPALRGRARPRLGRLPRLLAARPRGARARCRASSTCSPPAADWAGAGERPFLPRAISVAETGPAAERRPPRLPGRGRRPRHRPPLRARAGGGGLGHRPARQRLRRAARAQRPAPPARSWSAAASASPRSPCCAAASANGGCPLRVLLGFRNHEHSGGLELFCGAGAELCPEVRLASEDGHARPPRLRHRPARDDARRRRRRVAPSSTPAARRRCWRRCARSAPSATSPASWRMESPMACGFGACFGCAVPKPDGGYMRLCVDGPVRSGRWSRREGLRRRARGIPTTARQWARPSTSAGSSSSTR